MDYFDKIDRLEQEKQLARRYQIMDEFIEHLDGTIRYLLHYSKKNDITLPNLERIYDTIERLQEFVRKGDLDQPTGNTDNNYRRGNSTVRSVLIMSENTNLDECSCGRTHYAISTYYCSGCQKVEEQCTCDKIIK